MSATLATIAATTLEKHGGDIDKALPYFIKAVRDAKLIDDLARDYLGRVVGRGEGQLRGEDQRRPAEPTPIHHGSILVRDHDVRQHRRRTQAEKDAAEAALLAGAEAVFEMQVNGRAIGNFAVGELPALKRDLVAAAIQGIMLHTIEVRDAIIAEQIEQHCSVQDQLTRVREVVSAPMLNQFVANADRQAPRRIAEAMRHAAAAIEHATEVAA